MRMLTSWPPQKLDVVLGYADAEWVRPRCPRPGILSCQRGPKGECCSPGVSRDTKHARWEAEKWVKATRRSRCRKANHHDQHHGSPKEKVTANTTHNTDQLQTPGVDMQ